MTKTTRANSATAQRQDHRGLLRSIGRLRGVGGCPGYASGSSDRLLLFHHLILWLLASCCVRVASKDTFLPVPAILRSRQFPCVRRRTYLSKTMIYDNGSEFKLDFRALCDSYGIKSKQTTIKNPQANAILERVHLVIANMMRAREIDMADTIHEDDISDFLDDAA